MTVVRRQVLAGALTTLFAPATLRARARARVVVVGGGFGGATAARFLARAGHDVTLVEPRSSIVTCPFSNKVLGGFASLRDVTHTPAGLARDGVKVVQDRAIDVDGTRKQVTTEGNGELAYDRLILSPGIDLSFDTLPGYDSAASERMPHAWQAGPQTALLRTQLEAMDDGGLVVIAPPAAPYRCPPGPYERASLIAHYLKQEKPASRILILDAKESFSKQSLWQEAWDTLYPGMIEWVPPSLGGRVSEVDANSGRIITDFDSFQPAVANIIPPQRAAAIAFAAGVADATGWCPVDGLGFESDLVPGVHVIGDACFPGAMPKSAFSANAQAKVAAAAIDALFKGNAPQSPKLINTCYSFAAPDYGFTVAGVYGEADGKLFELRDAGGISPVGADRTVRQQEADHARSWYNTIVAESFG